MMKKKNLVLAVILLFITRDFALADRQLDKAEILQIFKTLTDEPRDSWIPSGTIEATHVSYNVSKGYTTESTVIVNYDGDRFYWEINVDSHTKKTEPPASSDGKSTQDDFDLNWNRKRVFAWDGERYMMYFRPGNHAIVTESPTDVPVVVNGPLTAGIVPWGYGVYTLESLLAAESSAAVDGQERVHMTILMDTDSLALEMAFVLDAKKDYAVLSYSQNNGGMASTIKTYGDYKLVSGRWIPATITIDLYDETKQAPELLSHDEWNLTSISISLPQQDSFSVAYEADALVEYYTSISDKPLWYRHSNEVDTDWLLYNRLEIVSTQDSQTQSCATIAIKYVSAQLGRDVNDLQLAVLVDEPNKGTSLYELQQFAQQLGFHCRAVKTDVQTLKGLKDSQAILHLPGPNHYVVLDRVDDEHVWIIDLDSNKFYYRIGLDEFDLDWSAGTALLVSSAPIDLSPTSTEVKDSELREIIGGFPTYSCTDKIQEGRIFTCSPMMFGICASVYRQFWPRYGCEEDENGGNCTGTGMPGSTACPCIEDIYWPGTCTWGGVWYTKYIRACQ